MSKIRFEKIAGLIKDANQNGLLFESDVLTGFSGHKLIGTLQRMAQFNVTADKVYLEVGVFQGLTLLSVASVTEHDVFGVDNFAFFDPEEKNYGIVKARREKLKLVNAKIINVDYEDALENIKKYIGDRKIGVYFIDGPHDYRSQLVCLLLAKPYLADDAIILIDDANYRHVRQANSDFLKSHPEYKLIFEAYSPRHPSNMPPEMKEEAIKGWWDGLNVIVRDKQNVLSPMFPATHRSREVYENEHPMHSSRFPMIGRLGAELAERYYQKRLWKIFRVNWKFFKKYWGNKDSNRGEFEKMNTYSAKLDTFNLNQDLK